MNEIFSLKDVPERQFRARFVRAIDQHYPDSVEITRIKYDLARQIAEMIMAKDGFFKISFEQLGPHGSAGKFMIVEGDSIIMTADEFQHIMKEQYKKGMRRFDGMINGY